MLGELMMFWPPPLVLQGRQSLKAMWSGETLPSGSGESSCAGDRHYLLWSRWCCCRLRVEAASKNLQWQNALRNRASLFQTSSRNPAERQRSENKFLFSCRYPRSRIIRDRACEFTPRLLANYESKGSSTDHKSWKVLRGSEEP